MASLVKKNIKGHSYYYIVWSARVNGKPRHVRQVYLGSAEQVAARLAAQIEPKFAPSGSYALNREFGASAALWSIAQELGLANLIDDHVPQQRREGNALTVGQYLTLAAINRCIAPTSKRTMGKWYTRSIVSTLLPAPARALEGQRFWDAMHHVEEEHINRIEEQLVIHIRQSLGLDLQRVLLDATNFFTFINTGTPSVLAQRGHNKAKRDDLRQVSLALLVSHDFGIPLFHHTYAGNVTDSTEFAAMLDPLVARVNKLTAVEEVTVVFDKGNNSASNFKRLDKVNLNFVGSLPPSHHKDLLKVPLEDFVDLRGERLAGVKAYRTTKKVFGRQRTIVMTWNPRLLKGQQAALLTYLEKKTRALREIQERLQRLQQRRTSHSKTTVDTVQREVQELLKRKELKQCITYHVGEQLGLPVLTYHVNEIAVQQLIEHLYGRNLIVTGRDQWSNEDIVLAYRGQYQLEHQFKNMKDHHALCWWPRFHWTDQKIRVHAFYCVLGLLLMSLLQRKFAHSGLDISIPSMLAELRDIQETTQVVRVPGEEAEAARVTTTLTRLNTVQEKMYYALNLENYLERGALGTTDRKRRKPHPACDQWQSAL
ncbi:MAG: IS1634 family transposase [Vulcanimicrobiota bacterium]